MDAFRCGVPVVGRMPVLVGAILLSRHGFFAKSVSSGRTLILTLINYVEITVCFAILYLSTGSVCQSGVTQPLDAVGQWQAGLYFSFITSATVGYGDFLPCGAWGQRIAIIQSFATLVLAAVVLSVVASRIPRPAGPGQDRVRGKGGVGPTNKKRGE